jgi:hypothetical protein
MSEARPIHPIVSTPLQSAFSAIPETPFVYWLRPHLFDILSWPKRLGQIADVRQGIGCADTDQFVRYFWEVVTKPSVISDWRPYLRGGGFKKWYGLTNSVVDWHQNGAQIKHSRSIIPSEHRYGNSGFTYTDVARGSLSCRVMPAGYFFSDSGPAIFPKQDGPAALGLLNSRFASYLLRLTCSSPLHFRMGYVANLPIDRDISGISNISDLCVAVKILTVKTDAIERGFDSLDAETDVPLGTTSDHNRAMTRMASLASLHAEPVNLDETVCCGN